MASRAVSTIVVLAGALAGGIAAAAPAGAAGACSPLGGAANVKTTVVPGVFPGIAAPDEAVTAFRVDGLDPGSCDGSNVQLIVTGNAAGDPALPASLLLTTANSVLGPCTQKPLAAPGTVAGGAITLVLCPAGGPAGYVDVREVTALALMVSGVPVPVGFGSVTPGGPAGSGGTTTTTTGTSGPVPVSTGTGATPGPDGGGSTTATTPTSLPTQVLGVTLNPAPRGRASAPLTGVLPFTGSDIGRAAWAGALAILLGLPMVLFVRRRRP